MIVRDWQNREYIIEIAFIRFGADCSGYIAYIDDEPYRDGEMFPSHALAQNSVESHLKGLGY